MVNKVAKWVKVNGKEYGLVNDHKVGDITHFARKGKDDCFVFEPTETPTDELYAALYDKHGGLIVDKDKKPVANGLFWDAPKCKPVMAKKEKPVEESK